MRLLQSIRKNDKRSKVRCKKCIYIVKPNNNENCNGFKKENIELVNNDNYKFKFLDVNFNKNENFKKVSNNNINLENSNKNDIDYNVIFNKVKKETENND